MLEGVLYPVKPQLWLTLVASLYLTQSDTNSPGVPMNIIIIIIVIALQYTDMWWHKCGWGWWPNENCGCMIRVRTEGQPDLTGSLKHNKAKTQALATDYN